MKTMNKKLNILFWLAPVLPILVLLLGSAPFLSAAPGSVKILYPNGGESLKAGSEVIVKWQSMGLATNEKVVLILYKQGIKHSVIAKQIPNVGSFRWKIPVAMGKGNHYRIRIRALKDLSVNDFSDRNFNIK
jgi:Kre9/KNH-like N-terminal Ig-like domain